MKQNLLDAAPKVPSGRCPLAPSAGIVFGFKNMRGQQ
jgi:hypothetical protein